jgi:hypothetical protein
MAMTTGAIKDDTSNRVLNSRKDKPRFGLLILLEFKLWFNCAVVDACKTLIALFEVKIKPKIAEVWTELGEDFC